ncbi:MAG: amidohydrolase family protein [Alphaproteobacteria bacterium]|nr:amidohydrolase family protein [Alphaproteobacteria bacterium]
MVGTFFASLLQSAIHQDPTIFKEEIVFEWMTTNGLKIIDSPKSGKIQVGERADLLLWDLKSPAFVPLPYGKLKSGFINNAPDIKPHTVLLNGNKIIENYNCISFLEKEAITAVNKWAATK